MRYERDVPLVGSADAAWRALSALPPARGNAAGYEGLAVVEDADDDARVATLRLTGAAGAASIAATAAVTVLDGRLHVVAVVRHGPGGLPIDEDTADDALGHLATTLAYALATASRPRRAWDAAVPPSTTAADTWDKPSPPPVPPSRVPIPADATLKTTVRPGEPAPSHEVAVTPPPTDVTPPPTDVTPPPTDVTPPPDEPPPPALPPAIVEPAPVLSTEVLTPRTRDVVHAGQEHPPDEHRRPWVRAGVAAAAGLAMLRILRSRR